MRNRNGKIIIAVLVSLCTYLLLFQAAEIRGEQQKGETDFVMVGFDEAKTLFEEGAAFVDARSADEYEKLHIEDAVLISKEKLDKDLLSIIYTSSKLWDGCDCQDTLRKKEINEIDCIVYGSGSSWRSHGDRQDDENVAAVAGRLSHKGFKHVFVMRDGFEAWRNAGYYTEPDLSFRADERSIVFFFMPGCQNCIWAKKRLDRMIDEDEVPIIEKSMALKENRRQREIYDSIYGVAEEKRGVVPALFIGEVSLVGKQEIKKNFRLSVVYEQGLVPVGETVEGESPDGESPDGNLLLRFRKFRPVSVAAAGLLDGVNPCAFAVLVFFLSYLAFTGRERRKLIVIGIVFIAAIFITYLLLGFGIFKFLEILKRFQIIIGIIYIVTAAVALVLAFFNITDSIKARGGDTRRLALQLSDRMKRLTHSIIRRHASSKYIVIVAGLTGFLISLFEFGCTGQIYLPTIVYIFDMPGFSYRALMFLILYNTMFIIPLLIILFAVAVFGVKSEIMGRKLASRIPVVKACTGGFFIFLAGYMIYISIHFIA